MHRIPLVRLSRLVALAAALFVGFATVASAQPATTKPAFTSRLPKAILAEIGDDVTLTISATGNPAPTLQWRKNKAALAGETASTLTLFDVGSSAAGTYDVVATNSRGSRNSSSTKLTVALAPATLPVGGLLSVNAVYRFGRETNNVVGSYQITSLNSIIDLDFPDDPATTFTYRRVAPNKATAVFNETYLDADLGTTVTSTETLKITFTQGASGSRQANFTSSGRLTFTVDGRRRTISARGSGSITLVTEQPVFVTTPQPPGITHPIPVITTTPGS